MSDKQSEIAALENTIKYDDQARTDRARERITFVDNLIDLRGKRVLEIGCGHGDIVKLLAEEYDCDAVGVDIQEHGTWTQFRTTPHLTLQIADIAGPHDLWQENSFDAIVSFTVWEHIRHPWTALQTCQKILRPRGHKYIHAYLNGSSRASHLYHYTSDPWPHLLYSPDEIKERYNLKELDWYFWCNKLSYQQYLFYFRQLGFHITYEHLMQYSFDEEVYGKQEQMLGLYPKFDLRTDGFLVVLEFDQAHPKEAIRDPVYWLRAR